MEVYVLMNPIELFQSCFNVDYSITQRLNFWINLIVLYQSCAIVRFNVDNLIMLMLGLFKCNKLLKNYF